MVGSGEVQLIVFKLGDEEYAMDILQAKEIIVKGEVTKVPNAPEFVEGLINLRGDIIPIIDLKKRFNVESKTEGNHIIIVELEKNSFAGIIVDGVSEIIRVPKKEIKPVPQVLTSLISAKYLTGVITMDKRIILIVDMRKILSPKELEKLSNLTTQQ